MSSWYFTGEKWEWWRWREGGNRSREAEKVNFDNWGQRRRGDKKTGRIDMWLGKRQTLWSINKWRSGSWWRRRQSSASSILEEIHNRHDVDNNSPSAAPATAALFDRTYHVWFFFLKMFSALISNIYEIIIITMSLFLLCWLGILRHLVSLLIICLSLYIDDKTKPKHLAEGHLVVGWNLSSASAAFTNNNFFVTPWFGRPHSDAIFLASAV